MTERNERSERKGCAPASPVRPELSGIGLLAGANVFQRMNTEQSGKLLVFSSACVMCLLRAKISAHSCGNLQ